MRLGELVAGLTPLAVEGGTLDLEIAEVRDDSRTVRPGDLFIASRGETVDGHDYLGEAERRGAVAAIVEGEARQPFSGVRVRVRSSKEALAAVAARRWGRPAEAMTLVAVTGTNGKTTTTYLVENMVRAAGGVPGVIGTVSYRWRDEVREAARTTPVPLVLHALLAEMRDAGVTHVVMEATSIAVVLGRLDGLRFQVVAFTNLSQDHLDFHGTMADYAAAKARLFREFLAPGGTGVVNLDSEWGPYMLQEVREASLTVAASGLPDLRLARSVETVEGVEAEFATPRGTLTVRSPLIGSFNRENLGVAVAIGLALGLDGAAIERGLLAVCVPGRLEPVANRRGIGIFVDYAHTPDALERVMAAVRPLVKGRLIVVFGCGGDRDRSKRPVMGQLVAQGADWPIVTSDNPRTEAPAAIIDMIVAGMRPVRADFDVEVDRRAAIARAVTMAHPGDVVLIAGKGHEDYQIIGTEKLPFDDREEARRVLVKLANSPATVQT